MLRDILFVAGTVISFLGLIISIATLLAICVTATVYYFQLKEMREATAASKKSADAATSAAKSAEETVKLAKEHAHTDMRAWVLVSGASIEAPIEANKPITVSVIVQNFGKTPAFDVYIEVWSAGTNETDPKKFKRPKLGSIPSAFSAAPGVPLTATADPPLVIDEGWVERLKRGESRLYAYGKVTYKDVFKEPHTTEFCLFQYPFGGILFAPYQDGNSAD